MLDAFAILLCLKSCWHNRLISLLPVGHAKFSPAISEDNIGFLEDSVAAINISATPNIAHLVGSQSSETIMPTYNWSDYFD